MSFGPPLILAFDTTTARASVALGTPEETLAEAPIPEPSGHAQRLLPAIAALLEGAGVGLERVARIAVTVGPGSFSGVRVGLATALGLSESLRIPAHGVPTLAALAETGVHGRVAALVAARRGEYYAQAFRKTGLACQPLGPPVVLATEDVAAWARAGQVDAVIGLGAGDPLRLELPPAIAQPADSPFLAAILLRAAATASAPQPLAPIYVRNSEAERKLGVPAPA